MAVLALAALLCIGLVAWALHDTYRLHTERESGRLQAVAQLRAGQVAGWLLQLQQQAGFFHGNVRLTADFLDWRRDPAGGGPLFDTLQRFRRASQASQLVLLDTEGQPLYREAEGLARSGSPQLLAVARRAIDTGRVLFTDPYTVQGARVPHRIDVVAPLRDARGVAHGALVLRIDLSQTLLPLLQDWPLPSETAETVLWKPEEGGFVALSGLRHRQAEPGVFRMPREPALLLSLLTAAREPGGAAVWGLDYRSVEVLGAISEVPGTAWFVVSKVDRAEVLGKTMRQAAWLSAGAVLLVMVLASAAGVAGMRRDVRALARDRDRQERVVRKLGLLDAIAAATPDVIFATDSAGRYVFFNAAAGRLTGQAPEDVIGHDVREVFPIDEAERLLAQNADLVERGEVISVEETLTTVEGPRTLLTTKGPLRDAGGEINGLFGIARDVTAQRRAERELRASEARFRLFVENAPAAIAMFDREMRYLCVSRRWLLDYNLHEADILGRPHYEIFPEIGDRWRALHRRGLAGEVLSADEDPFPRADGRMDWVRWEIRPWRDDAGEVGGILILSEVVTARREADERLRALSMAVEQSPGAILLADPHGRVEYVNEAFLQVTRYAREDLLGRAPGERPALSFEMADGEALGAALERGEAWIGEMQSLRADGSAYTVRLTVSPVRHPDGELANLLVIEEDVGSVRRVAAELEQYRRHLESLVAEQVRLREEERLEGL